MKFFTLLLSLSLLSFSLYAQEFRYRVDAKGFFDNLENSTQFEPTRTYAGIAVQPQVGMQLGNHALMMGVGVTQTFGGENKIDLDDVLLYYQYEKDEFNFIFGNYPTEYQYDYPKLFFSEASLFQDLACSGVLLQYNAEKGYAEVTADWMYQIQESRDEQFAITAIGERNWGNFSAGGSVMLTHNKYDIGEIYLFELCMQDIHVGYDFQPLVPCLDALKLTGGMLGTEQNLRFNEDELNQDGWDKAFGGYIEANIQWKGFGLTNNFYAGKGLMPYYSDLGSDMYWGNPFYQSNRYDRLDIYWEYSNEFMSIKPMFSCHFTPKQTSTQQFIMLSFNIDQVLKRKNRQ